jgi:hypothetical protein
LEAVKDVFHIGLFSHFCQPVSQLSTAASMTGKNLPSFIQEHFIRIGAHGKAMIPGVFVLGK